MVVATNRGTETGSPIHVNDLTQRAKSQTPSATLDVVSNAVGTTTRLGPQDPPFNQLSTIIVIISTVVILLMVLLGWIIYQKRALLCLLKTRRMKMRERQCALARASLQGQSNGKLFKISRPRPLQPQKGPCQCHHQSQCLESPDMERGSKHIIRSPESSGSAGSSDTVGSGTSGAVTIEDFVDEGSTGTPASSQQNFDLPSHDTLPVILGTPIDMRQELERKEKALPPPPVEFKNPLFSSKFRRFSVPLATVEEELCEYDIVPYLTGDRSVNSMPGSWGNRSPAKSTGRHSFSLASSSDHH